MGIAAVRWVAYLSSYRVGSYRVSYRVGPT